MTGKKPSPKNSRGPSTSLDPSKCLPVPRHERFAQFVAAGSPAGPAYKQAGFNVTNQKSQVAAASRLLATVIVAARVEYLKSEIARQFIDATALTRERVMLLIVEQHERNIGVRPVKHMRVIKTGKHKGEVEILTTSVYDSKAATQTAKMLADEYGLGEGGSASKGDQQDDMAARAGLNSPQVVDQIDNIRKARGLVLVGGKDKEKKTA